LERASAAAYDLTDRVDPMAFFDFIWVDSVVEKLAERDLSTDDIEAIIASPEGQGHEPFYRHAGRLWAFGRWSLRDGRVSLDRPGNRATHHCLRGS
jgi:hypothetical protein